jgi:hypothetical protein
VVVAGRMRATRPPLLSGSIAVPPAAGLPEAGEEERLGMCGHLSPLGLPPGPDGT